MQNPQKPIPARLSNRYDVIGVLGDGGFGTTFLVQDTQMPSARKCVLKQLKPVYDNPQIHQLVQERFQREAAILEQLGDRHEQIPRLYAYFSEDDHFYLVEEWIEGETLQQRLVRTGVQSEAAIRSMLVQILPAIQYVHQQQIVHRDIKPDNIVLRTPDDVPVLIDFGAVKETMSTIVNSQGNSSHSIIVGTPGFMPPEQMAGRPVYSSDLYGLGMTAIYLATGRVPQELRTDPRTGELIWQAFAPQISSEFAAVLNRSIQPYPQQRFSSAQEMLAALMPGSLGVAPSTLISAPQTPVPIATHTVALSQPHPASQVIPAQTGNDWKKAVMIGGIIGISILGGALLLRSQIPGLTGASEPVEKATRPIDSSTSPSLSPSPSPIEQPAQSPVAQTPQSPVSQPTQSQTPQSAPPANAPPAQNNPRPPSSSDDTAQTSQQNPSKDNAQQTPRPDSMGTSNATIVGDPGATNIRTGPGTNFSTRHIAYPGDRVRILATSRDDNGNLWYKIYFPISKADGWIYGQLLKPD